MRSISLKTTDGEILFAVGAVDIETIRDLCIDALTRDPKNMRIIHVLQGVSPYDDALPASMRKRLPR